MPSRKFVLGINGSFHDSSVALLDLEQDEPELVLSEDRHSGKAHHYGFPWFSLSTALDAAKGDIVAVGYSRDKEAFRQPPISYFSDILPPEVEIELRGRIKSLFARLENTYPEMDYLPGAVVELIAFCRAQPSVELHLRKRLNYLLVKFTNELFTEKQLRAFLPDVPIVGLNHHLTHAATYFASPFDHAAVITWDGRGEFDTTVLWEGKGGKLKRLETIEHPLSLGAFYEIFSEYVGFDRITGPGKMMGLAAYGTPRYVELFRKLITVEPHRFSFRFSPEFLFCTQSERLSVTQAFSELIGPPRKKGEDIQQHHKDIAYGAQKALEDACVELVQYAQRKTGSDQLVLSGGLSLNCVMNEHLRAQTGVRLFLLPPCGDDGTSLGAAHLMRQRALMESGRQSTRLRYHRTYGTETSRTEAEGLVTRLGLKWQSASARDLADLLQADKTIGFIAGRYEFGPRALCQRSILANPTHFNNWNRINHRIKFREDFRPFAPVMLREEAEALWGPLSHPVDSPYMLLAPVLKEKTRELIPAVVHRDRTARIQTVDPETQPFLHELLKEFKALSGIGCLLNTSLNMAGESIIIEPEDLLYFLAFSHLDAACIEGVLVEKPGNEEALSRLVTGLRDRSAYLSHRRHRYETFLDAHGYRSRYQNFAEFYEFVFGRPLAETFAFMGT